MIKENIYVAINHNDEIQWVKGSSSKTRYFRTDKYLKGAVEYHNKYHPEDIWKVKKCVIVEDNLQERDNESCDEIWEKAYKEREGKKMNGSFEFTLNNPLTEEDWDKIADVELENTPSITFKTPKGKQVKYIKSEVLDKVIAEIDRARFIDKDTRHCRNALASGLEVALQIIDKYKAESEDTDD